MLLRFTRILNPGVIVFRIKRNGIVPNGFRNPNDSTYIDYTSTHAEYSLLKSHRPDCQGIKHVLISRFYPKKLKTGYSRPCTTCQQLLKDHGVEKVTYTTKFNGILITENVNEF